LHGIGPNALNLLRAQRALAAKGLLFARKE
jgi:hypothetical protein